MLAPHFPHHLQFNNNHMLDLTYRHADQILKSPQGHSLYIGDATAAEQVAWLKQKNIHTVLTVANGFRMAYDGSIKHLRYDLQDKKTENISAYFDMAAFQIDKYLKSGSMLVHCGAGVSRSPTLVIAYLIKYKGMRFMESLKFVKSKRPQICPNLGFQLQLKAYEKSHNSTGNVFALTRKKRDKKQQLPEIVKYRPLATHNNSFHRTSDKSGNLSLSKSLKPVEKKQKTEMEYLRKMAEFRFGITNMSRWMINPPKNEQFKKPLHL